MNRYAVCFGQNAVDQFAGDYNPDGASSGGWAGILQGCVPDARDLAIALSRIGYDARAVLSGWNVGGPQMPWVMTGDATRLAWQAMHQDLRAKVKGGDSVVISNSGHGYQYDSPGLLQGEGMCFYDGMFRDIEMHELMKGWPAGVAVTYIIDTCYSGGADRHWGKWQPRVMPIEFKPAGRIERGEMKSSDIAAQIVWFAAAQKNQTAADGPHNGAYTGALLSVLQQSWMKGETLTRQEWFDTTASVMFGNFDQIPQLNVLGNGSQILDQPL